MNHLKILRPRPLIIAMFLAIAVFFNPDALPANDPPSDPCMMLPAAQLAKDLEQPFGSATKTKAPSAFPGSPWGTDCTYHTAKGPSRKLLLRVYVENSPAVAKETFERLAAYFQPNTAVKGPWDAAYLDGRHAIHVQKGKVRYYLNLDPVGTDTAKAEKQLQGLAAWVAGKL
ncbi:MAG TPA: hypothetical protein VG028_21975 [Terriglobia bacterium]|nr:hypothetical protein [Terriglobia bacterium]